ncbi:GDSL-type esterase/lipase family protein [Marinilabilia salmonicolor]|uniref:Lysophospholipase L1-like esterase n=1 Tax=Marinilabilia salmonicolor TaxID=989 RepID=A0A368UIU7_9BACT|nr:GDSL-type esterase/lipase family protein [Marinilabilia salmonicolor]RCW21887.1 lysophospholipase L1-like esterase [Marinilabilia salmonicolor]
MQKYILVSILLICSGFLRGQDIQLYYSGLEFLYPSGEVISQYHNDWTRVYCRQRINSFKANPLTHHEIVFIGNSLTEKGGNWSEKFGIAHIRNRGISGDVTDGVMKRLDEVTHFKPKAVFILIGINDLFNLHHDEGGRSNLKYFKIVPSAKYVAENILKIAKTIHQDSPDTQIYVRTVLPTRRDFLKDDILAVNKLVKQNEEEGIYTIVDLYAQFVDEEGRMLENLTVDGVHLNAEGYARWVNFERPILESVSETQNW